MFQRDFILRLIEQCADALATLMRKKRESPEAARRSIREAAQSIVGLEPEALLLLPGEQIVHLLTIQGQPNLARLAMSVRLLWESAELPQAEEGTPRHAHLRKAVELFTLLMPLVDARGDEALLSLHSATFAQLAAILIESEERTIPQTRALCCYFECVNRLDRAEDLLYELLELGPDEHERQFGAAFYRRLLARSDDELVAGGLPRDEVEEGLARLP